MTTTNPIYFLINKKHADPFAPPIESGTQAFAYQDQDQLIVLPFNNAISIGCDTYFQAPQKEMSLASFVEKTFSATNIAECAYGAGECVASIWRPGRLEADDIIRKLEVDPQFRSDKQTLLLLISKLLEILLFVEPTKEAMSVYGHRIRELHILACTEAEHYLRSYLECPDDINSSKRLTTSDYVTLKNQLHLNDYILHFPQYPSLPEIKPFERWETSNPSKTLAWYQDYNSSKHSRRTHFHCSSLQSAITATAAVTILFAIRYGPSHLYNGADSLSVQASQLFRLALDENSDPSTWYVPKVRLESRINSPQTLLVCGIHPWTRIPPGTRIVEQASSQS